MPAAADQRQLAPQIDAPARPPHCDYIYGIDLVRFACAVGVAVFHLTWRSPETAWVLPFGWVGVQVFFVISGLVIANSAQGATPPQFLTGRFLRIYPTAWCAAAVSFPLFLWEFPKMVDPLQRLYFSLILFPGPFIATAYWTLPVELAFYFLVYSVLMFNGFRHVRWLAVFLVLWGAPCVVGLALNARGLAHWNWVSFTYLWENMSLLRYGPYFGLGMLVWLYKQKRAGIIAFAAAALALLLAVMEIYTKAGEVLHDVARSVAGRHAWTELAIAGNIVFLAAFAAILLSVQFNQDFPASIRLRKTVRTLGLMTYPFYLLHERVGAFLLAQMSKLGFPYFPSVFVALVGIGLVSLAIAAYCEPALRRFLKSLGRSLSPAAKKPAFETP